MVKEHFVIHTLMQNTTQVYVVQIKTNQLSVEKKIALTQNTYFAAHLTLK